MLIILAAGTPLPLFGSPGEPHLEFPESEPRPRLSPSSGAASAARFLGGRSAQRHTEMLSLRDPLGESGVVACQQARGKRDSASAPLGGTVLQRCRIQDKCASGKISK